MTAHTCRTFDPSCYRCDLGRDEVAPELSPEERAVVERFETAPDPFGGA